MKSVVQNELVEQQRAGSSSVEAPKAATEGAKGTRLPIAWHVSPEQSVPIADKTGMAPQAALPILPAPAPIECCYL
jgi:hypothetical protein